MGARSRLRARVFQHVEAASLLEGGLLDLYGRAIALLERGESAHRIQDALRAVAEEFVGRSAFSRGWPDGHYFALQVAAQLQPCPGVSLLVIRDQLLRICDDVAQQPLHHRLEEWARGALAGGCDATRLGQAVGTISSLFEREASTANAADAVGDLADRLVRWCSPQAAIV